MVIFSLIHYETQLEKSMINIALKFLVFPNRINIYNIKLSSLIKFFNLASQRTLKNKAVDDFY
jgi:hypothetical protein